MPGRIYTELLELANEQHGYVTTKDTRALGIDAANLRMMHQRGILERTARGVYRFPMTVVPPTRMDEFAAAIAWPGGVVGVLAHETALDLYDVCDVNPDQIHFTVPRGHRIKRKIPALYVIHHADLPDEDVTRYEGLPITTVRRTIADCIDAGLRAGLIKQAIETARRQAMLTAEQTEELRNLARPRFAVGA